MFGKNVVDESVVQSVVRFEVLVLLRHQHMQRPNHTLTLLLLFYFLVVAWSEVIGKLFPKVSCDQFFTVEGDDDDDDDDFKPEDDEFDMESNAGFGKEGMDGDQALMTLEPTAPATPRRSRTRPARAAEGPAPAARDTLRPASNT